MNKNNGISAFKISQTQHKRMKMALWGIGILLAFQSIMDPLFSFKFIQCGSDVADAYTQK